MVCNEYVDWAKRRLDRADSVGDGSRIGHVKWGSDSASLFRDICGGLRIYVIACNVNTLPGEPRSDCSTYPLTSPRDQSRAAAYAVVRRQSTAPAFGEIS